MSSVVAHVCRWPERTGLVRCSTPWTGSPGDCELPDMGTVNQKILCKNRNCARPSSRLFCLSPWERQVDTQEAALFSDFCGKATVGILPMSASLWRGHLCSGPVGRRVTGLERKEVQASRREGGAQQADLGGSLYLIHQSSELAFYGKEPLR